MAHHAGMMGFFDAMPGRRQSGGRRSDSLRHRRLAAVCRRWAAALAVGIAVFAALQCVALSVRTCAVAVAAADLGRGRVVAGADVEVRRFPASAALDAAFGSADEVAGLVLQVDVPAGTPLFPAMARASPVAPPGSAVVDVRLTGDAERLVPGDVVSLMTGGDCTPQDAAPGPSDATGTDGSEPDGAGPDASAPNGSEPGGTGPGGEPSGDPSMENGTATPQEPYAPSGGGAGDAGALRACTLAAAAVVMDRARDDDMGGASVPFAMPADDAVRVMAMQDRGMIMAVATSDDAVP